MKKTFKKKLCTFFGYAILSALAVTYALVWSILFGIRTTCIAHGVATALLFTVWFALYLIGKGREHDRREDFNNWNYDLKKEGRNDDK